MLWGNLNHHDDAFYPKTKNKKEVPSDFMSERCHMSKACMMQLLRKASAASTRGQATAGLLCAAARLCDGLKLEQESDFSKVSNEFVSTKGVKQR